MSESQKCMECFDELCRGQGWRRTIQRSCIFEYLWRNSEHPGAEQVFQAVRSKIPAVSLDSVYRILNEFAEVGVIRRLENYEMIRFDPNLNEHYHFICEKCGKIIDIEANNDRLTSEPYRFAGEIKNFELRIRGICHQCLSRNDHKKNKQEVSYVSSKGLKNS